MAYPTRGTTRSETTARGVAAETAQTFRVALGGDLRLGGAVPTVPALPGLGKTGRGRPPPTGESWVVLRPSD